MIDKKDLNQDLNKIEVFLLHKAKKANGDIKTKILINTNLTAYVTTKFNKPIEIIDFKIPSKEKMSKLEFNVNVEFNFVIREEKHIWVLNRFSPTCLIPLDTKDTKYIISSQINKEKFIHIA